MKTSEAYFGSFLVGRKGYALYVTLRIAQNRISFVVRDSYEDYEL